jgi:signal transduction histidine kinase
MESMLDDLLVYARTGREALPVERVAITELIEEVSGIYDPTQLALQVTGVQPVIETHVAPLRLVLQNLIDNAIKYSDSQPAAVRVLVREDDDTLTISVSDDGPGIDPRFQSKIFLPFRKLERPEEKPGTGMGLALARRAVETHNGTISVASNPAERRGATFTFTWPKHLETKADLDEGKTHPEATSDPPRR